MTKKRVVLANLPRMLASIVTDLVDRQPDMAVVGSVKLADVAIVVSCLRAEAVILTPSRADPEHRAREQLRRNYPGLTVLELRVRDDHAVVWAPSQGPEVVDLSASGIVAAIRAPEAAGKGGRN